MEAEEKPAKKKAKKAAKKSSKKKSSERPEPDVIEAEAMKLHYVIDRRDFLEKVKSVYASYAA